jgi:hypothetical protein
MLLRSTRQSRYKRYIHIYTYAFNWYLGLFGRVGEVDDYVDGLNEAAGGIDGDEEALVGLEQRVVDPQHRAEERHNVRDRLEALGRLVLVDPIESRPANIEHAP